MARFKSRAPNELLYSLFAFIIIAIAVHAVYVTLVRPRAEAVLAEQRAAMQKDPNYVAQRSVYVVLKDWEQESAIILALWALRSPSMVPPMMLTLVTRGRNRTE